MKTRELREFNKAFGIPTPLTPTYKGKYKLRESLIKEELEEYVEACEQKDVIEVADAITDMAYLVLGAAVEHGMDLNPLFKEVHLSNMSKLENGKVITRGDGKVLKGKNYFPPNIKKALYDDYSKDPTCQEFIDKTVEVVCDYFQKSPIDIFKKSRLRELVEIRQIIFYIIHRRFTSWRYYGHQLRKWTDLDRITITKHSVKMVENMLSYDDALNGEVNYLYSTILKEL